MLSVEGNPEEDSELVPGYWVVNERIGMEANAKEETWEGQKPFANEI